MNRKKFLIISAVIASGVAVPVVVRMARSGVWRQPLIHPWFLAHLFDTKTIKEIGTAYRSQAPAENAEQELTRLLLANPAGPVVSADDDPAVKDLLDKKVQSDFNAGSIVTVDGWVLSVTEARQCALFSMKGN